MTYRLIAIDDNDSPRAIGRYPDYESALLARITDVIDQLRANDGWWTRADHVIVGPGVDGPDTEHPLCTGLGLGTNRDRVPIDDDVEEAHRWLLRAHELAYPEASPT